MYRPSHRRRPDHTSIAELVEHYATAAGMCLVVLLAFTLWLAWIVQ